MTNFNKYHLKIGDRVIQYENGTVHKNGCDYYDRNKEGYWIYTLEGEAVISYPYQHITDALEHILETV